MQRTTIIPALILIIMTGCGEKKQQLTGDIITIDVTNNYPKKELILQDFMDVEYVPLETNDDFLTQGLIQDVGKKYIIAINRTDDGEIFIFSRSGKAIKKINRKGQSGEEYSQVMDIILDEEQKELFVQDYPQKKILVYDLDGKFKRNIKLPDDSYYIQIYNYDPNNLICYRSYLPIDNEQSRHLIISKQDGSIVREIPIPFKNIKTPIIMKDGGHITPGFDLTIPIQSGWTLMNTSSDTVYEYSLDHLTPLIVRTPSIQTMSPEIFLFPLLITDRYYFIKTMKKEFDFEAMKGYPSTNLIYDRQDNTIFEYTIRNADFTIPEQTYLILGSINNEIATWYFIDSFRLVEAYNNGNLTGKLKEIASTLTEEDNPVIMLIKHKK